MSGAVLQVLKSANAPNALTKVNEFAELLTTTSVFSNIRLAAVWSGLLSDSAALALLTEGRDDVRKAVIKAHADGLYSFAYTDAVKAACKALFARDVYQYWQIALGGDLVSIMTGSSPSADTARLIAKRAPLPSLMRLLQVGQGVAEKGWLLAWLHRNRLENAPDSLYAEIAQMLLYTPNKWRRDVDLKKQASRVFGWFWLRKGAVMTDLLVNFNAQASPVLNLEELFSLSQRKHATTWNRQFATFVALKPRLRDMPFSERCRLLSFARPIKKAARSHNCAAMLELISDVAGSPKTRCALLRQCNRQRSLPASVLARVVVTDLLPSEPLPRLPEVYAMGRALLGSERAPHKPQPRGPQEPYKEYMLDQHRLDLFEALLTHKHALAVLSDNDVETNFALLVQSLARLSAIRSATGLLGNALGERVTAALVLPAVRQMATVDAVECADAIAESTALKDDPTPVTRSPAELPMELLRHLQEGSSSESCLLLSHVCDAKSAAAMVQQLGRTAFWSLLVYGLGGQAPVLGPTKAPALRSSEDEAEHGMILVGADDGEEQEPDEEFEDKLKVQCMGADIYRRREGLATVIRGCSAAGKFRRPRLQYVITRLVSEPDHTKLALMRELFRAVDTVQEFVFLASAIRPLFDQCLLSSLSGELTELLSPISTRTLKAVADGSLMPQAEGALLSRAVLAITQPDHLLSHMVQEHVETLSGQGKIEVLQFICEGAEAAIAATEKHAAKYSLGCLQALLSFCKHAGRTPQELLALPWAKALMDGLKGDSAEFVLYQAANMLTDTYCFDWSPVSAAQLQKSLAELGDAQSVEQVPLFRDHLKALCYRRHRMEAEQKRRAEGKPSNSPLPQREQVLDFKSTDEAISTATKLLVRALGSAATADVNVCLTELFGNKKSVDVAWASNLAPKHAVAICEAQMDRLVLTTCKQMSKVSRVLQVLLLNAKLDGESAGELDRVVCKLAGRGDAMYIIVISSHLTEHLVRHRPSLLRAALQKLHGKLTLEQEPTLVAELDQQAAAKQRGSGRGATDEFIEQVAHALSPWCSFLTEPTAKALSLVLRMECEPSTATASCLALLLKHVDSVGYLTKRLQTMQQKDVLAVLAAAATARHPRRTIQLIVGGTPLKHTSTRDLFDRNLTDLPRGQARAIIQDVFNSGKVGPSVTTRCLRLVKSMRLPEPMGLYLAAWQEGNCHQDVLVFLLQTLAQEAAAAAPAKPLFNIARIQPKHAKYVTQSVIDGLCTSTWDSEHLLGFLSDAVDQHVATAQSVFDFLLQRLRHAAVLGCKETLVQLVTSMLERSRTLGQATLHAIPELASGWKNVNLENFHRHCLSGGFNQIGLCSDATVRALLSALHRNNVEPWPQGLFKVWSDTMLHEARELSNRKNRQEAVNFALSLAGSDATALRELSADEVIRGAAVEIVQSVLQLLCQEDQVGSPAKGNLFNLALARVPSRSQPVVAALARCPHLPTLVRWNRLFAQGILLHLAQLAAASKAGTEEAIALLVKVAAIDSARHAKREERRQQLRAAGQASDGEPTVDEQHRLTVVVLRALTRDEASLLDPMPLLEWLSSAEVVASGHGTSIRAMADIALRALRADTGHASRLSELLAPFRTRPQLKDFPDTLLDFRCVDAAAAWVRNAVVVYEDQEAAGHRDAEGRLPRVPVFSERVARAAASSALLPSRSPSMRLQALRFLELSELQAVAREDQDYAVKMAAAMYAREKEKAAKEEAQKQ